MVVPVAALLLLLGVVIFALRLSLRPARTHGSSYPLFGHIKFWFLAVLALVAVGTAAARPFWVYGGRSFKRGDVDVAIVLDGSASMWVKDLGSSRLELAVREAAEPLHSGDSDSGRPRGAVRVRYHDRTKSTFVIRCGPVRGAGWPGRAAGNALWRRVSVGQRHRVRRSSTSTSRSTTKTGSRRATRDGRRNDDRTVWCCCSRMATSSPTQGRWHG